jgi:hypothetical protein
MRSKFCALFKWRPAASGRRACGGDRGDSRRCFLETFIPNPRPILRRANVWARGPSARLARRSSLGPFLVPSRSLPFTWQRGPRWAPQRAPQRVPEPPLGRRPSGRRPSGRGRGRGRGQAPPPWEPPATNEWRLTGLGFAARVHGARRGRRPAAALARRGRGAPPSSPPSWAPRPWAPGAPVGPLRASFPSPPRPCRRARPPLQASSQVGGACWCALWAMHVLGTAAGARDALEAHSARVHGPEALWGTHLALLATSCVAFLTSPLALSASF